MILCLCALFCLCLSESWAILIAFKQSEFPSTQRKRKLNKSYSPTLTDLNVTDAVDEVTDLVGLRQVQLDSIGKINKMVVIDA